MNHIRRRELVKAFGHGFMHGLSLIGGGLVAGVTRVRAEIGPGELLVAIGLTLIAVSLWPLIDRLALLPVGIVLVWIGLPSRMAFLIRPSSGERKPRRTA